MGGARFVCAWLGVLLFLGAANAAAAPRWQVPVVVAPPGVPGSSFLFELSVDPAGNALLGFSLPTGPCETPTDCPAEMFVRARPSGQAWLPPFALGGNQHGAYIRDLVGSANGQGAVAAELGNFFRPFGDVLAVSDGAGSDWHPIEAPWGSEFPNRHVVLRSDARGNLFVLWQESRRLWVAIRPVDAAKWQSASLLSETAGLFSGRLAVGERGDALAVWQEQQQTTVAAIRSASSNSWGRPEAIATGRLLALAVGRRGDMLLLDYAAPDIRARFRPAASSWLPAEWIGTAPDGAFLTSVQFDDAGNAVAIWSALQSATSRRIASAVRDRRRGWKSTFVSPVGEWANSPRLAVGGSGRSVVVWDFNKPDGYGVHAALRTPRSNRWSAPVELDPGQSGWQPQVGIDSRGHALAVWERRRPDGPAGPLMASELIDNGPLITRVRMPGKTSVKLRARFRVEVDGWLVSAVPSPRWRFGDGAVASGFEVAHTYKRAGTYPITVTVTDRAGGKYSARRTLIVRPRGSTHTHQQHGFMERPESNLGGAAS